MSDHPIDKKAQSFDLTLMSHFVHQVVNPLNAICGTLDNIASGDVPAGSIKQRIRASRSQIEYCVELIRNLAFLAEYERDPDGYAKEHTGGITVVPQCLIEAALFFQEIARKKKMTIHLTDRDTQYKVRADSGLLRQVFINVFDNCVKYGRQSTDITVNAHIQKSTGDLIIEIINVGDQVPRDLWERIFERGFRGRTLGRWWRLVQVSVFIFVDQYWRSIRGQSHIELAPIASPFSQFAFPRQWYEKVRGQAQDRPRHRRRAVSDRMADRVLSRARLRCRRGQ